MVKHYFREEFIATPDDVQVSLNGNEVKVSGPKGTLQRSFSHPKIELSIKDKKIRIYIKKPARRTSHCSEPGGDT